MSLCPGLFLKKKIDFLEVFLKVIEIIFKIRENSRNFKKFQENFGKSERNFLKNRPWSLLCYAITLIVASIHIRSFNAKKKKHRAEDLYRMRFISKVYAHVCVNTKKKNKTMFCLVFNELFQKSFVMKFLACSYRY